VADSLVDLKSMDVKTNDLSPDDSSNLVDSGSWSKDGSVHSGVNDDCSSVVEVVVDVCEHSCRELSSTECGSVTSASNNVDGKGTSIGWDDGIIGVGIDRVEGGNRDVDEVSSLVECSRESGDMESSVLDVPVDGLRLSRQISWETVIISSLTPQWSPSISRWLRKVVSSSWESSRGEVTWSSERSRYIDIVSSWKNIS